MTSTALTFWMGCAFGVIATLAVVGIVGSLRKMWRVREEWRQVSRGRRY